jgi:hypothetical protein
MKVCFDDGQLSVLLAAYGYCKQKDVKAIEKNTFAHKDC